MIERTPAPAMSIVLATPGDFSTIAMTVRYLRRQTIASRIELVIVARGSDALSAEEGALQDFWGWQLVEVGEIGSVGGANAAGVRNARGPVIAFAEDHCFPEPGWAEALLESYGGDEVAAVGPVFRNANPGTLVSWCDFVIGYGPWMDPTIRDDQPFLAGHNSSYRRAVLLELDDRLEAALEAETVLHGELRRRGYRLLVQARARAAHANFAKLRSWLPVQYHCGRVYAARRATHWGRARRTAYACGSPLIPVVRLVRALGQLRRAARPRPSVPRLMPLLGLGLAVDGVGQLLGYLAGAGGSAQELARFEFRRVDHVPEADRRLWTDFESHASEASRGS
jgi:hypothetical protein